MSTSKINTKSIDQSAIQSAAASTGPSLSLTSHPHFFVCTSVLKVGSPSRCPRSFYSALGFLGATSCFRVSLDNGSGGSTSALFFHGCDILQQGQEYKDGGNSHDGI
jgi:hypothetical protein